jgi:hypothetical protein
MLREPSDKGVGFVSLTEALGLITPDGAGYGRLARDLRGFRA